MATFSAVTIFGVSQTSKSIRAESIHSIIVAKRLMKKRRLHRSLPGRMMVIESPTAVKVSIALTRPKASKSSQLFISFCTSPPPGKRVSDILKLRSYGLLGDGFKEITTCSGAPGIKSIFDVGSKIHHIGVGVEAK